MEANLDRFRGADTQVLGVSIDSVHSHANWARSLGGVSFPLLADFHPKGEMSQGFGAFLEGAGITDRATVIIDKEGKVRYAESVTPAGKRDIAALAAKCEEINGSKATAAARPVLKEGTRLFVKSRCGFSLRVANAIANLRLALKAENVSESPDLAAELEKLGGKNQAPCLVVDGKPMYEADAITRALADMVAPLD